MKKYVKILLISILLSSFQNCDSSKSNLDAVDVQFACSVLSDCNPNRGSKFGILGDSWTDLVFGVDAIETLRVQLTKYGGYNVVGSTLGGQTLKTVYNTGLHYKVIDEAGPNIKYMLLSLGGNDIQGNPVTYLNNVENEKNSRFATLRENLLNLIRTGNLYKINKWGGNSITWIIHGYDYPNPDAATGFNCRTYLVNLGFSSSDVDTFQQSILNSYNDYLKTLTFEETTLKYIDLRGTLSGPPSKVDYMYDCIHPNSIGFRLIGERYIKTLEGYTNNER
ncbi:MAG: SGNH/GDSL hydrolase family protein [Leptospiraceae bacterium]|nr:SGNH/GDSL hydrolase family protein [Leptospiraceae bacterium]